MRICFLAPANSAHTEKWCRYFTGRGHEVHVISFTAGSIENAQVHALDTGAAPGGGDMQKLLYLTAALKVKKLVRQIKPDIINVHYASSYGTVAALAGLRNYILSVWGSDIYDFPCRSPLHRLILKYSLSRAEYLFSTSTAMAQEAGKYTKKSFTITPFGVDTSLFTPEKRRRFDCDGQFIAGNIKSLEPNYGIDILLEAAKIIRKNHPEIPLKIRIAGDGSCEREYRQLAKDLSLEDVTTWLGRIPQEQAAEEWANMDLAIICSRRESFGVSAVEAEASGVPVVISDIPGLMEATNPGITSIVVPKCNAQAVADAAVKLYSDPVLRREMGEKAVQYVHEHYEYTACFQKIEKFYEKLLEKNNA